ncbi:MAG: rhomboid family intramembrane serine protease, partial [Oleiphilaceae bacterium]|nr:rhomboid family intramembrane serine protease [Oleiphilaceae bacterium]
THIRISQQFKIVMGLGLLISVIELLNLLSGRSLSFYGLIPRQQEGLIGIVTAPFLHADVVPFSSNILPLCILSFLLLQHGLVRFILVSVFVVSVAGGLVWLFARPAIHLGASGLIYGYFAYLLIAGWLSREVKLLAIAILVAAFYGGMIWGVLPGEVFISWEFHLFGFLAGVMAAFIWGRAARR